MKNKGIEVTFVTPFKSGPEEIQAWAHSEDAELVVHPFLTNHGPDERRWVVSHKRTGFAISQHYCPMPDRSSALRLAAAMEPVAKWSKISRSPRGRTRRSISGWSESEWTAASKACALIMSKFRSKRAAA